MLLSQTPKQSDLKSLSSSSLSSSNPFPTPPLPSVSSSLPPPSSMAIHQCSSLLPPQRPPFFSNPNKYPEMSGRGCKWDHWPGTANIRAARTIHSHHPDASLLSTHLPDMSSLTDFTLSRWESMSSSAYNLSCRLLKEERHCLRVQPAKAASYYWPLRWAPLKMAMFWLKKVVGPLNQPLIADLIFLEPVVGNSTFL